MTDHIDEMFDRLKANFRELLNDAREYGVAAERARFKAIFDGLAMPATSAALAPKPVPAPAPPPEAQTAVLAVGETGTVLRNTPSESNIALLPDLVDAAKLPPLTPGQFKTFGVVVAANGAYMTVAEIDRRVGLSGAAQHVYAIEKKGYIVSRPAPPAPGRNCNARTWHCIVFGAPRVFQGLGRAQEPDPKPKLALINTATRRINAAEYLEKRGQTCDKVDDSWWQLNGVKVTKMSILIQVNKFRAAAELAAVDIDQIE